MNQVKKQMNQNFLLYDLFVCFNYLNYTSSIQLKLRFTIIIKIMVTSTLPEYCLECSWLFSKMGACRPPNVSLFFSLVSFIPYLLIFLFIGLSLIMRGRKQIKITILMITAYIIADRIIKNLIAMPRPEGACKTTFGFPSSHMVALCTYIFEMMPNCNKSQKFFFLFLIISQAMARIHLKYHTWSQVIGGAIFALVYVYIFNILYTEFEKTSFCKRLYEIFKVQQNLERRKNISSKTD